MGGKGLEIWSEEMSEGKDVKAKGGMGSGRDGWEVDGREGKWKGWMGSGREG